MEINKNNNCNIEEKIIEIVRENIDKSKRQNITRDTRLLEDLEIDSFGMLMIINGIEDEFAITVDEKQWAGVKTIGDIISKSEEFGL